MRERVVDGLEIGGFLPWFAVFSGGGRVSPLFFLVWWWLLSSSFAFFLLHPFRFDCGMGEGVVRSDAPVIFNSWNILTIYRDGWTAWMQLNDGQQVSGQSKGLFSRITFRLELFLGGSPNVSLISHRVHATRGFVGCVRSLEINGRLYDFRSDSRGDSIDGLDIGKASHSREDFVFDAVHLFRFRDPFAQERGDTHTHTQDQMFALLCFWTNEPQSTLSNKHPIVIIPHKCLMMMIFLLSFFLLGSDPKINAFQMFAAGHHVSMGASAWQFNRTEGNVSVHLASQDQHAKSVTLGPPTPSLPQNANPSVSNPSPAPPFPGQQILT